MDKRKYQRGLLIYLSHTRHNIAYAMSIVSRFMHDPGESHMLAIEKILHYLKNAASKRAAI